MKRSFARPSCGPRSAGALAATLLLGGCAADGAGPSVAGGPVSGASVSGVLVSQSASSREPALSTASYSERVDTTQPTFSDPTTITNPLFPISTLTQVIQVGAEAGERLRHEITLLPRTRTIEWMGQDVETLVRQFAAYRDGQILEVAYDYFAEADDGSVWYFGEDVDNYEDGVIADHEGSWLAGRDGPPGMIMPAKPERGDVYRPENIPGLVFEEVTVQSVDERVEGPTAPVDKAILVEEMLMDGTREAKILAPGYGEFRAEVVTEEELVTVSVATPIDTIRGQVPNDLGQISGSALDILATDDTKDWAHIGASRAALTTAWDSYRHSDVSLPSVEQMQAALDALGPAVADEDHDDTRAAAAEVANAAFDLELRHRSAALVDVSRLHLQSRQLLGDAAAHKTEFVLGDIATLQTIWDRSAYAVDGKVRAKVNALLADLHAAVDVGDFVSAPVIGGQLHALFSDLRG